MYQTHTLNNGLQIISKPEKSEVVYCGVAVNAGSRDELDGEFGLAHFVEHLLFKGTQRRSARQIINQIENAGGEINAFTAKEETVIYAAVPRKCLASAIALIADVVQNSAFEQAEFTKEKTVIIDEIESYNDNPAELILDDFENRLFENQPLGHFILGDKRSISRYKPADAKKFFHKNYTPDRMTLFVMGDVEMKKIVNLAEKNFTGISGNENFRPLQENFQTLQNTGKTVVCNRRTHQTHAIIGAPCCNLYHTERMTMYLLNNLLGGSGMGSRLNLSLRERRGLVYSVESVFQPFTDNGQWLVYYACAKENADYCQELIYRELRKLKEKPVSDGALKNFKRQLAGQMAISSENRENMAISLGKSFMRYGAVDSLDDIRKKITAVTAEKILNMANETFREEKFLVLKYT